MRRGYVDIPEGQMHYRFCGQGPALIMLHMSGSSSQEYEQVGNILAPYFTVYAVDFLAFGGSDRPPRQYSLSEHAETVVSFMEALGIDRAYFFGNLVGSNIAVRLALKHPEKVIKLMLGQYCFDTDYEHFRARYYDPCFLPIHPKRDGSHLAEIWARAGKYDVPAEYIDQRALCLHIAGDMGEALHLALFSEENFNELLPNLTVPTVVIAYKAFAEWGMETHVAGMIPNAALDEIADATPYVPRTNPQTVAVMILKHFGR